MVSNLLAGEHLDIKFHKDINQNTANKHGKEKVNTSQDDVKTCTTIPMHAWN